MASDAPMASNVPTHRPDVAWILQCIPTTVTTQQDIKDYDTVWLIWYSEDANADPGITFNRKLVHDIVFRKDIMQYKSITGYLIDPTLVRLKIYDGGWKTNEITQGLYDMLYPKYDKAVTRQFEDKLEEIHSKRRVATGLGDWQKAKDLQIEYAQWPKTGPELLHHFLDIDHKKFGQIKSAIYLSKYGEASKS